MRRHRRLVPGVFALLLAAWVVAAVVSGADTGLLHLAPALVLCAPLLVGRYLGERQLARLAGRGHSAPRLRGGSIVVPRGRPRLMRRGGRLVASSLAKRPPPAAAPLPTA